MIKDFIESSISFGFTITMGHLKIKCFNEKKSYEIYIPTDVNLLLKLENIVAEMKKTLLYCSSSNIPGEFVEYLTGDNNESS